MHTSELNFPMSFTLSCCGAGRRALLAAALAGGCLLGCNAVPEKRAEPLALANAANPDASNSGPVAPAPAPVAVAPAPDALAPVLLYADQVRALQGTELTQEIARFTDLSAPEDQVRLALALVQTRQLYDLVRAQELLQRVLANGTSHARQLHPVVRLLAARFSEQRRVEDQLDRQGQQLRDAQRRLEQTNDKLEALKEIERSLSRPGAPPAQAPVQSTTPGARSRSRAATP